MRYANRQKAGAAVAKAVAGFGKDDSVVLALPRGGVVVGAEVARALSLPLGVVLVRKIGHPAHQEYAVGAVAQGQEPIFNEAVVAELDADWLNSAVEQAHALIARRYSLYYDDSFKPPQIKNKTVILVDDGIATGLTMLAAAKAVRSQQPKRLIIAVPVAPPEATNQFAGIADKVIILDDPNNFRGAVGSHYDDFAEVTDDEVAVMLRDANEQE